MATFTEQSKAATSTFTPAVKNVNQPAGQNLVTNGSFSGSAAGWTLVGSAVYGTNNIIIPANLSEANRINQTSSTQLINDYIYHCTMNIVSITGTVGLDIALGQQVLATPITLGINTFDFTITPGTGGNYFFQIGAIGTASSVTITGITVQLRSQQTPTWTALSKH